MVDQEVSDDHEVWLCFAALDVASRILAIVFPISAFVARLLLPVAASLLLAVDSSARLGRSACARSAMAAAIPR